MCCRRKKKIVRDVIFDDPTLNPQLTQLQLQQQQRLAQLQASGIGMNGGSDRGTAKGAAGRRMRSRPSLENGGRNGNGGGGGGIYRNSNEPGHRGRHSRTRRDDDTLRNIPHKMPEYDAEDEPFFFEQKCQDIQRQQLESLLAESDKEAEGLATPAPPTRLSAKTARKTEKSPKKEQPKEKEKEKEGAAPAPATKKPTTAATAASQADESKSFRRGVGEVRSRRMTRNAARLSSIDLLGRSSKKDMGSAATSRNSQTDEVTRKSSKSKATKSVDTREEKVVVVKKT